DADPSDDVIVEFAELYRQRMDELSATAQYYFSNEYFFNLLKNTSLIAYLRLGSKMVCAVLLLDHPHYLEYHLSAANTEARASGATNLIIHNIATHFCNEKNYFHLGGGNNSNIDNSLLEFKRGVTTLSGEFLIGKKVHQPEHYTQLRSLFSNQTSQRVIFYRD
ncbi:MAG: GNAT family N-acetyltransferase, partial [Chitinophagaceae bacterium]